MGIKKQKKIEDRVDRIGFGPQVGLKSVVGKVNHSKKDFSPVAQELLIEYYEKYFGCPVEFAPNLITAFKMNAEKGGQVYYLANDHNFQISVEAINMLQDFQKPFIKNFANSASLKNSEKAHSFASDAYEKIKEIRENFLQSNTKPTFQSIANNLINLGIQLPRGGNDWTATAVRRIINRFEKNESQ